MPNRDEGRDWGDTGCQDRGCDPPGPAWREGSGGHRWRHGVVQSTQGGEEAGADGFAAKELEVVLAGVGWSASREDGTARGGAAWAAPSARSRRGSVRAGSAASGRPRRRGSTAGRCRRCRQPPSCRPTAGPVPRSAAGPRRPCCRGATRSGVDATDVGQHVRLAQDLVGVERQRSLGLGGPRGPDREETHAPTACPSPSTAPRPERRLRPWATLQAAAWMFGGSYGCYGIEDCWRRCPEPQLDGGTTVCSCKKMDEGADEEDPNDDYWECTVNHYGPGENPAGGGGVVEVEASVKTT